jgi:hypothetical protein
MFEDEGLVWHTSTDASLEAGEIVAKPQRGYCSYGPDQKYEQVSAEQLRKKLEDGEISGEDVKVVKKLRRKVSPVSEKEYTKSKRRPLNKVNFLTLGESIYVPPPLKQRTTTGEKKNIPRQPREGKLPQTQIQQTTTQQQRGPPVSIRGGFPKQESFPSSRPTITSSTPSGGQGKQINNLPRERPKFEYVPNRGNNNRPTMSTLPKLLEYFPTTKQQPGGGASPLLIPEDVSAHYDDQDDDNDNDW